MAQPLESVQRACPCRRGERCENCEDNLRLHSPLVTRVLACGFATAMYVLFRTLRLRHHASLPETNPYDSSRSQRFLYCVWHDSMVIPAFGGKHSHTIALTSRHADGSFVAHVLSWKRVATIRGSTNRITTGALRELMQRAETHHIVITPDGPRGPARQVSTGIAFLASRTTHAVVPTAFACSRYWRWKGSWSDLIIPKPFATVVLLAGDPISVPANLTLEQLRQQAASIQAQMERLGKLAECELGRIMARDDHPHHPPE